MVLALELEVCSEKVLMTVSVFPPLELLLYFTRYSQFLEVGGREKRGLDKRNLNCIEAGPFLPWGMFTSILSEERAKALL